MKRIYAGVLIFILCILGASGCGRVTENGEDNGLGLYGERGIGEGAPGEASPGDTADINDDPTVARVNGVYILASDMKIHLPQVEERMVWEFFMTYGEWELDPEMPHPSGVSFGRAMREEAVRMAAFYTVFNAYARELGIALMPFEQEMIDAELAFLVEHFGELEFDALLREEGFRNAQHLAELYASQIILDNLVTAILTDPEEFRRFEGLIPPEDTVPELLGAKHILANFDNFDSEADAEAFAYALLARVLAGEDFDMLVAQYGQDHGMHTFVNGYSFAAGDMVPEFEAATRALELGEISGLVESEFGIHIIKRTEPNVYDWHMLHNTQPRSLQERMTQAIFRGLEQMVDDAEIIFLPGLDA
ncbi:MAG: peptidylprolyl isomerase [Defluviitaleaceae bacterium]|nr:peptidylprolyl isomerase [Defluviitaleaceae bacterium]MCL2238651.1 peptidylprolyl isomerase [Defluviitaleaceae bacterium]